MSTIDAAAYQARQSEKDFQATVIEFAEYNGWIAVHFPNAIINPIWPDLTLIRGRRTIFAELKTERGKLGPKQAERLAELEAIGAEVHVWRPSSWPVIELALERAQGEIFSPQSDGSRKKADYPDHDHAASS